MYYIHHPFQMELHKLENVVAQVRYVQNNVDNQLKIGEGDKVTTQALGEEGGMK